MGGSEFEGLINANEGRVYSSETKFRFKEFKAVANWDFHNLANVVRNRYACCT